MELVLYCPRHIQRLENDNCFPKRLRLGNEPLSRVAWLVSEVLEWLQNVMIHSTFSLTPPSSWWRVGSC
jgi:predicted DNA-binding transcriptional regulator AlpA